MIQIETKHTLIVSLTFLPRIKLKRKQMASSTASNNSTKNCSRHPPPITLRQLSMATATSSTSRHTSRSHSGPLIPPTGLITGRSTPISIQEPPRKKKEYGESVTKVNPNGEKNIRFGVARAVIMLGALGVLIGVGVGVLVMIMMGSYVILYGVGGIVLVIGVVRVWNWWRGEVEVERFFRMCPDSVIDKWKLPVGEIVKITGVVTCGPANLETSYQNITSCVYVSTELYQYRGWKGSPINPTHKPFTWALRHSEKNISDFFISDPASGERFYVRAGNGARVVSFVKSTTIVDMTKKNRELTPAFRNWLTDHNITSDDNDIMRLEEGFIREGGIASVMGICRKHESLNIIDQPRDIISTGCQWLRCLFPMFVEGLVVLGDRTLEAEVYHV